MARLLLGRSAALAPHLYGSPVCCMKLSSNAGKQHPLLKTLWYQKTFPGSASTGQPNTTQLSSLAKGGKPLAGSVSGYSALSAKAVYPTSVAGSLNYLNHLNALQQARGICEDKQNINIVDAIREDLQHVKCAPTPALVLGTLGLIPFALPMLSMIGSGLFSCSAAWNQAYFCACVLSFIGGTRWGYVIPEKSQHKPDWCQLGYGALPATIAWLSLLMPLGLCQIVQMGTLVGTAYFDVLQKCYPPWYRGLRVALTAGALFCLFATFLLGYILPVCDRRKPCGPCPCPCPCP
jgi:hypothetical protein